MRKLWSVIHSCDDRTVARSQFEVPTAMSIISACGLQSKAAEDLAAVGARPTGLASPRHPRLVLPHHVSCRTWRASAPAGLPGPKCPCARGRAFVLITALGHAGLKWPCATRRACEVDALTAPPRTPAGRVSAWVLIIGPDQVLRSTGFQAGQGPHPPSPQALSTHRCCSAMLRGSFLCGVAASPVGQHRVLGYVGKGGPR